MNKPLADSASFRDPRGQVFQHNGRIFRTVMPSAKDDFAFVRATELIKDLIVEEKLLPEKKVDVALLGEAAAGADYLLEHPVLPFISYPYEWPFVLLKSAALLQLEIHLQALEYGVTLTDSSAFNIQFHNSKLVFIDHLAFRRYQPGEIWQGHRQFCEQFLNPLLLQAYLGVPYQDWYRGRLEGITAQELNRLLPFYRKFSPKVFMHVVLQSSLQKTTTTDAKKIVKKINLPLTTLKNMLSGLKDWIEKLQPKNIRQTIWSDYSAEYLASPQKINLVKEFIKSTKPKLVFDLGCNIGLYSKLALQVGAEFVVGIDSDQGALDRAVKLVNQERLNFLPLYMDLANPSPNQGWADVERKSFMARGPADAVMALALVHHLAIAHNIPLTKIIDYLLGLAPQGLVEFVPKTDPQVQSMLSLREDIFKDYSEESFLNYLKQRAEIIKNEVVSASGRKLIWYKSKT